MKRVETVSRIAPRERGGHKGRYGRVLVLAGSLRMTGAAHLASRAALRGGSGLVTLGVPDRIHAIVASGVTSVMTLPLPSTGTGAFAEEAAEPALAFLAGCDAFALGPGLDTHDATGRFVDAITRRAPCPGVLDADALNLLADLPAATTLEAATPRVLTPHPGEMARLLGTTIDDVESDRAAAVRRLMTERGVVAVLKGAGTLVADADRIFVNDTGNPGMATAGSGDVLTGLLVSFLGQGFDPFDAAVLATHVHGRAGDLAAARLGEASVTADDILDDLSHAVREHGEQ
jgi:ADP-dependent NAD(P)H-hydrate dehydratase / NAD(P)H-hydrate epimerase